MKCMYRDCIHCGGVHIASSVKKLEARITACKEAGAWCECDLDVTPCRCID